MTDQEYIATIGLEIHAELATNSKMFCSCRNDPDEETPNKNVCSICLGHPGTLPVLNKEAINHVLKMGVALGGTLADFTEWDRKNYFYPDIPKGYQISQYKYPLVSGGSLAGVELERIHLEEDTAQSTHDTHQKSLVNFNRAGVPLMELVTKPVIHDGATAVRFAGELQLLLRYLGAGEANMEKGEMRIEANISVASPADTAAGKFGTKTEVKNLNSFRSVEKAIEYEIERQSELLREGGKVIQETRGWDDGKSETYSQRKKESSHDYRYFPDPDIPKLKLSEIPEFSIENLKKELPELPWIKRERFAKDFGMTEKEVAVFVESPEAADYYEQVVSYFAAGDSKSIKLATNYVLTDYLKLVKDTTAAARSAEITMENKASGILEATPSLLWSLSPSVFAELIGMINAGELSSRGAKDLLKILFTEKGISAKKTAEAKGLIQKNDPSALIPAIEQVLADNPKAIAEYKAGKLPSLQFLVGMAMKATKGAGNPEMIKKIIVEKLG
ncbi:MAG: Asp-tRNA(Asn)/Glu-tRNA(Gln) amidotransferase subunit GatB [Candidatus Pacebacteria bacterium]|nr:Asp-tRNA(Asn)/Glu-tRNA(Gln) amidotransferase subunit GatB [Candidatus Paceibacterota bacterium]